MSVNLFTSNEAAKIANTLSKELDPRAVWYAYVSNVTAYNLQYKETALIDFEGWEKAGEDTLTRDEAIEELKSLWYNAATNAGNVFMPERELNHIQDYMTLITPSKDMLANYNND